MLHALLCFAPPLRSFSLTSQEQKCDAVFFLLPLFYFPHRYIIEAGRLSGLQQLS